MTPPVDEAVTASGVLQNPIVVVVLALLVIVGLAGDVAGKWVGPVTAIKARRDARTPPAGPAPNPQVTALEGTIRYLEERLDRMDTELSDLRADRDGLVNWSRSARNEINRLGGDVPPLPELTTKGSL